MLLCMTGQHLLVLLLLHLPVLLLLFVLSCKLKLQMKLNINIISQHLKPNGIMIMKREKPDKSLLDQPLAGVYYKSSTKRSRGEEGGRRAARRTRAEMKTSCFRMKFLNYDVFFGLVGRDVTESRYYHRHHHLRPSLGIKLIQNAARTRARTLSLSSPLFQAEPFA